MVLGRLVKGLLVKDFVNGRLVNRTIGQRTIGQGTIGQAGLFVKRTADQKCKFYIMETLLNCQFSYLVSIQTTAPSTKLTTMNYLINSASTRP